MTLHEVCKGCRWNNYPECLGTKMDNGEYMKINNLKSSFQCGQKNSDITMDFSIVKKTTLELRMEEIEARIQELEK